MVGNLKSLLQPLPKLLLVLLCIGTITPARAEQVVDLYQTQSLVRSQSASERAQAAADGLAEVILRASGHPSALRAPPIVEALRRAQSYVYEFRYESTDEKLIIDQREVPATRIIMKFSSRTVEKLLREARLPMWPANRRSLVVWLVLDDVRGGRQLVNETDYPEHFKAVQAAGVRRGLPMIFPLQDLQDRVSLPADAAWRLDEDTIREASERYKSDGILLGRYSRTSRGEWRATWLLLQDQLPAYLQSSQLYGEQQSRKTSQIFDSVGMDLEAVIADGVDQVANYLASLYAIVPRGNAGAGAGAVVMKLEGINHFGSYIQVLKYLESLAMVRRVNLMAVHENTLKVQLYTEGELALLIDALGLDRKLQPVPSVGGDPAAVPQWLGPKGSAENPLLYTWSGT